MQIAAREVSFDKAMREVEQSLQALENLCECHECSPASESSAEIFDFSTSCLVRMAYAIREISRTMAHVVQDPQHQNLLPCVEGIKDFAQASKTDKPRQGINESSDQKSQRDRASFARDALGLGTRIGHPLYAVSLLFQGPDLPERANRTLQEQMQRNTTALSKRGVCCYMNGLCELSCQAESVRWFMLCLVIFIIKTGSTPLLKIAIL